MTRQFNEGENSLLNKEYQDHWISTCRRKKLDPFLMLYTKTILKWGLELHLNFRAKILKLLEENIRVNLHDLGLGKAFLYML